MFTKNLFLAAALATLGGIAVSSAAVAEDAESKTLLNNMYQQVSSVACSTVVSCYAYFPPMTDTTTVIEGVSCFFEVTQGTNAIVAMGATGTTAQIALQPFFLANTGALNVGVNASTKLFVTKGQAVYIEVYAVGGTNEQQMNCTISGYHS
jgi:hypothetical protein